MRQKKDELDLIHSCNASIIALQATKLSDDFNIRIPYYNLLCKEGHYNHGQHGGVALYIHSDVPYNEIKLNTPCQAVAAKDFISFKFSICNIYSSRSHPLNLQLLSDIFRQLTSPCLIVGVFNAYSLQWGSASTDSRGRIIEAFLSDNNLNIWNDGSPTRIADNSETAIDLPLCSPSISFKFSNCNIYSSRSHPLNPYPTYIVNYQALAL